MVSFNFSPFSRDAGLQPALLPGFEDTTPRNLDMKIALHIACSVGNNAVVEDLLKFECTKRNSCLSILLCEDKNGRIPLHYAQTDDMVKTLLRYEAIGSSFSFPPAVGTSLTSRLLGVKDNVSVRPIESIVHDCSDDFICWILETYDVMYENGSVPYLDLLLGLSRGFGKKRAIDQLRNMGAKEAGASLVGAWSPQRPSALLVARYKLSSYRP